jgi:hypothetical protein
MDNDEILLKVIKQQAEIFLLDAGEFFPFGTCINKENKIIPTAAYLEDEDDRPESQPLIEMLEGSLKRGLNNGEYIIGAVAFDILLTENGEKHDAIAIRIYETDAFRERIFKYYIHQNHVEFI